MTVKIAGLVKYWYPTSDLGSLVVRSPGAPLVGGEDAGAAVEISGAGAAVDTAAARSVARRSIPVFGNF